MDPFQPFHTGTVDPNVWDDWHRFQCNISTYRLTITNEYKNLLFRKDAACFMSIPLQRCTEQKPYSRVVEMHLQTTLQQKPWCYRKICGIQGTQGHTEHVFLSSSRLYALRACHFRGSFYFEHTVFGPQAPAMLRKMKQVSALLKQYRSCVSHMCVKKTKHPNDLESRVYNNDPPLPPTCSKVSLIWLKVRPLPISRPHMKNVMVQTSCTTCKYHFYLYSRY